MQTDVDIAVAVATDGPDGHDVRCLFRRRISRRPDSADSKGNDLWHVRESHPCGHVQGHATEQGLGSLVLLDRPLDRSSVPQRVYTTPPTKISVGGPMESDLF